MWFKIVRLAWESNQWHLQVQIRGYVSEYRPLSIVVLVTTPSGSAVDVPIGSIARDPGYVLGGCVPLSTPTLADVLEHGRWIVVVTKELFEIPLDPPPYANGVDTMLVHVTAVRNTWREGKDFVVGYQNRGQEEIPLPYYVTLEVPLNGPS